jgi:hypothetical protein
MKHRIIDINKVAFSVVQKADYEFSGLFVYIIHNLSEIIQVAFFDAQDE